MTGCGLNGHTPGGAETHQKRSRSAHRPESGSDTNRRGPGRDDLTSNLDLSSDMSKGFPDRSVLFRCLLDRTGRPRGQLRLHPLQAPRSRQPLPLGVCTGVFAVVGAPDHVQLLGGGTTSRRPRPGRRATGRCGTWSPSPKDPRWQLPRWSVSGRCGPSQGPPESRHTADANRGEVNQRGTGGQPRGCHEDRAKPMATLLTPRRSMIRA
jgi:hypothetical protein